MNEPEILEAYRGVGRPTSPPFDLLERVNDRIRRRRATRRGLAGLAAAAVAGGVCLGVVAQGGTDGDDGRFAGDPGGGTDTSTLTYTDTDGSTYTFGAPDFDVACNSEGTRLYLARNASIDAVRAGRGPHEIKESQLVLPVLYVELIVDKVTPGQTFDLPYDTGQATEKLPMRVFFTAGDDLDSANELSSVQTGSSGTVTVRDATCGPTPSLWIEIDGILGSEVEQPPLAIRGEYRS